MKTTDLKRMWKLAGKSSALPIIEKTALIKGGIATSTNLETTLSVPTDITGEGVVDLNWLKKLGKYDLAWIEGDLIMAQKGNVILKNPVQNPEDFPKEPEAYEPFGFIEKDGVAKMQATVPFAGKDELRPMMSALSLEPKQCFATDAFLMRWEKLDERTTLIPETLNIPKLSVDLLDPGVDHYEIQCSRHPETKQIVRVAFSDGNETLYTRIYEGRFPNCRAVTPRLNDVKAIVSRDQILSAISNALLCCNKTTMHGVFNFRQSGLTVSSRDIDYNTEHSETIPCELTGVQSLEIGFNLELLQKAIKSLPIKPVVQRNGQTIDFITTPEQLEFLMSHENRAAVLNRKVLVMPVMLHPIGARIENEEKLPPDFDYAKGDKVQVFDHLFDETYYGIVDKVYGNTAIGQAVYDVIYEPAKGKEPKKTIWAFGSFVKAWHTEAEPTETPVKTWENYYAHLPENPGFINVLLGFEDAYRAGEEMELSRVVSDKFAGPDKSDFRQNFINWLTGNKLPKAKSGIMAIEKATLELFKTVTTATTTETPIKAVSKIGKNIEAPSPKFQAPSPKTEEPSPKPEEQPDTASQQNSITAAQLFVIENLTEKSFAIIGCLDMLPEEFRTKYGSQANLNIETQRVPGLMFSKKRRAMLSEIIESAKIQFASI